MSVGFRTDFRAEWVQLRCSRNATSAALLDNNAIASPPVGLPGNLCIAANPDSGAIKAGLTILRLDVDANGLQNARERRRARSSSPMLLQRGPDCPGNTARAVSTRCRWATRLAARKIVVRRIKVQLGLMTPALSRAGSLISALRFPIFRNHNLR
jgi:hypothetical protein